MCAELDERAGIEDNPLMETGEEQAGATCEVDAERADTPADQPRASDPYRWRASLRHWSKASPHSTPVFRDTSHLRSCGSEHAIVAVQATGNSHASS